MSTTKPVFILNGPNLNLLGTREPEIYGHGTLADVEAACGQTAKSLGYEIDFRQTNTEGTLIDWIQEAAGGRALILNAAAYTHVSIALMDALKAVSIPKIEVHLSNIAAREEFRHISYVAAAVDGVIAGFGANGYVMALNALKALEERATTR